MASPLWAGFTANINGLAQVNKLPSIGFPNPALYHLARTSAYNADFNDITSGCTYVSYTNLSQCDSSTSAYNATLGYDLTTGLGSPKCSLIAALSGASPAVPRASDIVWSNSTSGSVELWRMKATSGVGPGGSPYGATYQVPEIASYPVLGDASGWSIEGTGDFNGDGQGDILFRQYPDGDTDIWLLQNGSILSTADWTGASTQWWIAGTGDFNGDGTSDILWRNLSSGTVEIWGFEDGVPNNWPIVYTDLSLDWVVQKTGDFNGDGTTDILWRQTSTGDVVIWEMANFAIATTTAPENPSAEWTVQATGDLNGDGTTDILWMDTSGDLSAWIMSEGWISASWGMGTVSGMTVGAIADFDGDGVGDILWRQANSDIVPLWLIRPTPGSASWIYLEVGTAPSVWQIEGSVAD
jgi:hypothetical protein